MAALFFLAFAYFAVGQAAVTRNGAQTAADSAALAAARQLRDEVKDTFLQDLDGADIAGLKQLLAAAGPDNGAACAAAESYAEANDAIVLPQRCLPVYGPPGYTVTVQTKGTVGRSVVDGTENKHAKATATAVVEPRCTVEDKGGDKGAAGGKGVGDPGAGGKGEGHTIGFTCEGSGPVTIDPKDPGFTLDLSDFYTVHLSK
jgi:hypothetical protein